MKEKWRRVAALGLAVLLMAASGCSGNGETASGQTGAGEESAGSGETVILRILENDTAKAEGYLDELLAAFNEAYADRGIQAVDANMDEYTDLAANGPYGYGPDVLYQANDQLMTYAEDRHILPLDIESFDCYAHTPEAAWEAFRLTVDGETYYCGIPVNIQEPMLFYRADRMPEDWEENWDDDGNGVPDFFENWNDMYAYSQYLRDTDPSPGQNSQYGFMASLSNLYLSSQFIFSYGAYVFGEQDGVLDTTDIGFSAGDTVNGLSALKQMAALMNEGCIDDTITLNRYENLANGTYFCAVSTPDTLSLFVSRLASQYELEGLGEEEALAKAEENIRMVEMPGKMPADGDLSRDSSTMSEEDWVDSVVMGGVNGYGISSYTEHREECMEFVNFATSYEMIRLRSEMLGIAPTRQDVAEVSGDTADMIFASLAEGRIYLMPSVKAVDQIWTPTETMLGDVAKDAFREKNGEAVKYPGKEELQAALETIDQNIYDAVHTLAD